MTDEPMYAEPRAMFEREVREHEMTILHDDGVYRHLRFAKPGTGIWHFDIITWPGHLATAGDVADGYQFARVHDMFDFFRPTAEPWRINPSYWHEKMPTPLRDHAERFSAEKFEKVTRERVAELELTDAQKTELLGLLETDVFGIDDRGAAIHALEDTWWLADGPHRDLFTDSWDHEYNDWDYHFLIALFAIVWGIERYREHKAAEAPRPEAAA